MIKQIKSDFFSLSSEKINENSKQNESFEIPEWFDEKKILGSHIKSSENTTKEPQSNKKSSVHDSLPMTDPVDWESFEKTLREKFMILQKNDEILLHEFQKLKNFVLEKFKGMREFEEKTRLLIDQQRDMFLSFENKKKDFQKILKESEELIHIMRIELEEARKEIKFLKQL